MDHVIVIPFLIGYVLLSAVMVVKQSMIKGVFVWNALAVLLARFRLFGLMEWFNRATFLMDAEIPVLSFRKLFTGNMSCSSVRPFLPPSWIS